MEKLEICDQVLTSSSLLQNTSFHVVRDLMHQDGWKTQDGRVTKKCRARPGMHSLARHFSSFCRPVFFLYIYYCYYYYYYYYYYFYYYYYYFIKTFTYIAIQYITLITNKLLQESLTYIGKSHYHDFSPSLF